MAHGDQAFGGGSLDDRREAPFSGLSGSGLVKDTISPKGGRNGRDSRKNNLADLVSISNERDISPTRVDPEPAPVKQELGTITEADSPKFGYGTEQYKAGPSLIRQQQQEMSDDEAEEGGMPGLASISSLKNLIDFSQKTTPQPVMSSPGWFDKFGGYDARNEGPEVGQVGRYGGVESAYNLLNVLPGTSATRTYGGPTETISGDPGFEHQTTFNPLSGLIGTAAAVGTLGLSAAAGKIPTGLGMLVGSMTKDLEIPVGSFNKEQRTKLAAQKAQLVKEGLLSADRVTQYTPSEPSEGRDDQPIKKPVLPRGFQTNTGKAAISDIPTGSPDLAIPSGPSRARLRAFRSRRLR